MAIYIQDYQIVRFRGIRDLTVHGLNHLNLIVGDNNCGKTSVLESLLLLRNPGDLSNVMRIARQRDVALFSSRVSIYENFINLFPQNESRGEIRITALCNDEKSAEQKYSRSAQKTTGRRYPLQCTIGVVPRL